LISNFVFGGVLAAVVGICAAGFVVILWYAIPLRRRLQGE
jgi:hypothetical protein